MGRRDAGCGRGELKAQGTSKAAISQPRTWIVARLSSLRSSSVARAQQQRASAATQRPPFISGCVVSYGLVCTLCGAGCAALGGGACGHCFRVLRSWMRRLVATQWVRSEPRATSICRRPGAVRAPAWYCSNESCKLQLYNSPVWETNAAKPSVLLQHADTQIVAHTPAHNRPDCGDGGCAIEGCWACRSWVDHIISMLGSADGKMLVSCENRNREQRARGAATLTQCCEMDEGHQLNR